MRRPFRISADSVAETPSVTRRAFIAGAAATAFTIIKPELVRGTAANSKIELGIVGMGQRGRRIGRALAAHGGYAITAVADYFPEVSRAGAERFGVDPARCFSGLLGYRRLIESKVDAVILETPPYCFPEHAAAAVEAGCHVYMAKPIACDAPGCLAIAAAGKQATAKNKVFMVDFQIRTDPFWIESVKRVHENAIGKLSMLRSHFTGEAFDDPPPGDTIESRLQNLVWCNDVELGGGHMVNAAVHAIDAACWVAGDRPPLCAMGLSRRNRPAPHGSSHDTYTVIYDFEGGPILNHQSEHLPHQVGDGNFCGLTAYGVDGTLFGGYDWKTWIHGNKTGYRGGQSKDLAQEGILRNIETFHAHVSAGICDNTTVPTAVNSTLTAILGREACLAGGTLTWDRMIETGRKVEADLRGLKE